MDQTRLEELAGHLESAKKAIQAKLVEALRASGPNDQAAATLIAGATRIIGLSNAVALLCRYGRGAQAVSLVQSMVVTALAMCWAVSAADMGEALRQETTALETWKSDDALTPAADQFEADGLTDSQAEGAQALLKRMGLPAPGSVVAEGPNPEDALAAADRAMTAALWAMEKRWPAAFPALS